MARKDYSQKRWSKEEKGLLRMWMDEHPNAKFYRGTIPKDLAELLPERSSHKIYCAWYNEKAKGKPVATKQTNTLTKLPVQPYSVGKIDVMREINTHINKIVQSQITIHATRIQQLEAENAQLREERERHVGMLRDTKAIRESVYKFRNQWDGKDIHV